MTQAPVPTLAPAATEAGAIDLVFTRRPPALRNMPGAFRGSARTRPGEPLPAIRAQWRGFRASGRDIADFARLCGLGAAADRLPPLFLHAMVFRLQMVVLTHPAAPVPIWRMLQVRNQLLDTQPVRPAAMLDMQCRPHALRILPKGLEIDLHSTVTQEGRLVAESINTFYARGNFGAADAADVPAAPVAADAQQVARWRPATDGRLRFAFLTGDYNPVHVVDAYARAMGFRRAFFHPLRVVGQCLARAGLQDAPLPRRLDVWLKGPVFHDADLQLGAGMREGATVLSLVAGEDPRPAVVVLAGDIAGSGQPCGKTPV